MAIYHIDDWRKKRTDPDPEPLDGELLPPAPPLPGTVVIKARRLPPGIRSLSPALRAHTARAGRVVLVHTVRVIHPVTVARTTRLTLRGAGRITVQTVRYLTGADKTELRKAKADKHHELVRSRQQGVLILTVAAGLGLFLAPPVATYLAASLAVIACLAVGRQGNKILADTPALLGATDTVIRQAFVHARLAKAPEDIKLVAPVQRTGSGWATTVELPPGTAANKARKHSAELAGALNLPVHRLEITEDPGHAGRVQIRASDIDPLAGEPVPNPLVTSPIPVDLWSPLPIGVDSTGRLVDVELVFSGMLVGGLPRRGKSVACANVLVGALLDPHCQLWLVDGKGLDSRPLIPHATHHVGKDIDQFAAMMNELEQEMDRRYDRLARLELDKLSRGVCHAEMPLILLSIDELARYTADQDKIAKQAVNTLRNIVSVGPAAGIIPLLATQKPSSKIVPTDIRDLIPLRLAVACSTRAQSNTILGDEATVSAADLPRETKGAAWLIDDTATMFRPYLVDGPALREVAGKMTTGTQKATTDLLATVLAAMGPEDRMRSAELAARLNLTQEQLADALRDYGVRPRQLGRLGPDTNPRGYKKADILAATRGATTPLHTRYM